MDGNPRVKEMLFANVPGDDPKVLDRAETDAIVWFCSHGWNLRNIMKTNLPGGMAEIVVDAGEFDVSVPWDRHDIDHSMKDAREFADDAAKLERLNRLERLKIGRTVEKRLATFVGKLIPRPAAGAGILWTVTAMPSTGGDTRAATLSCQNLEVLVINRDGSGFINCKDVPDDQLDECIERDMEPMRQLGWKFRGSKVVAPDGRSVRRLSYPARYANADGVFSEEFENLGQLCLLLQDPMTLLWSYRLVAELLRRGPSMYRRFHNPYLAAKILNECSTGRLEALS
jgi:hypothetical protein